MGEKKLISPEFRVTVGEYEIKDGVEVECFSSRESHIDWCRVELSPRLQGLIQFKDMDEAQVELGYEDDFDTLIDGYVRCNGSDYWKEIMIKDDMMKLERATVKGTFIDCTPQDIIRYILTRAGITAYELTDEAYGKKKVYSIEEKSGTAAIAEINSSFYTASEAELPAGTYNITVGANWGNNCKTGEKYQFVLTKPVPQGGMLVGFWGMPDKTPAEWRVSSYRDGASTEAIETVSVTAGSAGTSLGTFTPAGDGSLNSLHRLSYGYNRWSQSAMRQWLNSDKPAGQWWTSQNKFDRVPEQHATKAGFMSGFEKEFLDCIQPIKVVTALNTVSDKADGETEVTYDTFFLPALEQMYINPQLAGEGDVWEYWKRASGMSTKMQQWQTYPQIRTYAIESHTSAQDVRLHSANLDYACRTWRVNSSGYVNGYGYAVSALRCAPVCVIC